jgi:hypothetical protein
MFLNSIESYQNLIEMPRTKKFGGTVNACVPGTVKNQVLAIAKDEDLSTSDVVRHLLQEGLRARGLDA